jgi:hypothetical protein
MKALLNMTGWLLFLGSIFLGRSCTEQVDWDLDYQGEDMIVVEARITNEPQSTRVRITRPVYEMNGTPAPVSGASVQINDGRNLHTLREHTGQPGTYMAEPGFAGEVGRGYQLRIGLGDRRISAVAYMAPVEGFPYMRLVKVQDQPVLYEAYISDQNGPSVIRLELDWSHVPGYETLPADENHALIYHYTLESVDVNRIFAPEKEHVQFPPGTVVYREKESVSRAYGEYLRGMLSETDWRGGVFDVLPGNPSNNFNGEAYGYFTAAAIIRDTIVIPQ